MSCFYRCLKRSFNGKRLLLNQTGRYFNIFPLIPGKMQNLVLITLNCKITICKTYQLCIIIISTGIRQFSICVPHVIRRNQYSFFCLIHNDFLRRNSHRRNHGQYHAETQQKCHYFFLHVLPPSYFVFFIFHKNESYSIPSETIVAVLNILSACKAEDGSGVFPPPTDDNTTDGKIGSADTIVSGRMEH